MTQFNHSHSADSRFLPLVARPRFLRVIPSVLLLTTAMAWGVSAQAATPGAEGGLRSGAAATLSAGVVKGGAALDAGVRLGANEKVTEEQRAAAMQVAQGAMGAGAGGDAGATTGGSPSGAVGGVRGTGQAAGGSAAPMGESAVGGVRSDATGGMSGPSGTSAKGAKTGKADKLDKTEKGDASEAKPDEIGGLKGNVGSVPKKLDKTKRNGAMGAAGAGAAGGVDADAAGVKLDADGKAGAGVKGKSPAPY